MGVYSLDAITPVNPNGSCPWLTIASKVREATAALHRICSGLAMTKRSNVAVRSIPVFHAIGIGRVLVAEIAPKAKTFDSPEIAPNVGPEARSYPWSRYTIRKIRPLTSQEWDDIRADVPIVRAHLHDLAQTFADEDEQLHQRWTDAGIAFDEFWTATKTGDRLALSKYF